MKTMEPVSPGEYVIQFRISSISQPASPTLRVMLDNKMIAEHHLYCTTLWKEIAFTVDVAEEGYLELKFEDIAESIVMVDKQYVGHFDGDNILERKDQWPTMLL